MLTVAACKNAKPAEKTRRLFDQRGLYLEISPAGGKWWRLKYRIDGKEKRLSLGTYPDVSLHQARDDRDDLRRLIRKGIDPSAERRAAKKAEAGTFEAVAREWYGKRSKEWAPSHGKRVFRRLELDVFPYLGARQAREIEPTDVLPVAERIENRGKLETARRVVQSIGAVMRYAVATGHADRDPTRDLRGILASVKKRHFPAFTDPKAVGDLLRMIEDYDGYPTVRAALRIAPYLFVRPGELRHMLWDDLDFEAREWRFTTSKTETAHLVPLPARVIEILEELRPLTGSGRYVFQGLRGDRPISDMTLGAALRRLGIDTRTEHTMHGWRATARTLLHEKLDYPPDVIEHQLAHRVPDVLGDAYNRTRFLKQRRKMMNKWAAYLDSLRAGAKVVAFDATRG